MDNRPFLLTIDRSNGGFTAFHATQDEAEADLREWAAANGFATDNHEALLEALRAADVDVWLSHAGNGTVARVELFERPPTFEQP